MDGAQLLAISRSDLLTAVRDYIVDSKAGDTLSYRETAALDIGPVSESSTESLWSKLQVACGELQPATEPVAELESEPVRLRFDAQQVSDLAQCFIDETDVQFDVFVGADGSTLVAQSVKSPQNGAFALGKGSTGELIVDTATQALLDANELGGHPHDDMPADKPTIFDPFA